MHCFICPWLITYKLTPYLLSFEIFCSTKNLTYWAIHEMFSNSQDSFTKYFQYNSFLLKVLTVPEISHLEATSFRPLYSSGIERPVKEIHHNVFLVGKKNLMDCDFLRFGNEAKCYCIFYNVSVMREGCVEARSAQLQKLPYRL
jgi:hypothetical protein